VEGTKRTNPCEMRPTWEKIRGDGGMVGGIPGMGRPRPRMLGNFQVSGYVTEEKKKKGKLERNMGRPAGVGRTPE